MNITTKVGGSSVANPERHRQAVRRIKENPARTHIVVSALGKRSNSDIKITDQLLSLKLPASRAETLGAIEGRHLDHARSLGINEPMEQIVRGGIQEICHLLERPWCRSTEAFVVSRGEYFAAHMTGLLLGYPVADAKHHVRFNSRGEYDSRGYDTEIPERAVFPGFYGSDARGYIHLLPRNGSDITGAQVAVRTKASLLEIGKDVPGIHPANPDLAPIARRHVIKYLGYSQAEEMSYRGYPVIQDQAVALLRKEGIAARIFDILGEETPGTLILPDEDPRVTGGPTFLGIGERDGFTMFVIQCPGMNLSRTFTFKLMGILKELGIRYDHIATGTNVLSLIVRNEELPTEGAKVLASRIKRAFRAKVTTISGLANICIVGNRLGAHPAKVSELLNALESITDNSEQEVRPIKTYFYEQGGAGTSLVFGVRSDRLKVAVQLLYRSMNSMR